MLCVFENPIFRSSEFCDCFEFADSWVSKTPPPGHSLSEGYFELTGQSATEVLRVVLGSTRPSYWDGYWSPMAASLCACSIHPLATPALRSARLTSSNQTTSRAALPSL